jgi:predicted MFS family arabinose efflux permease
MTAVPRALSPLRHPHYRWLATSLSLSLLGNGLWAVALVWQVVDLGGGPAALSLVTGVAAGGMLVSTLVGGALADRLPQRHILLAVALTEGVAMATAAALSFTGVLALGHLAAVGLVTGIAAGCYYPAYSALVPVLLPPSDLLAANGLEGVVRPILAQAAGPAAAGFLVAAFSPGAALATASAVAFGAAVCVTSLPVPGTAGDGAGGSAVTGLFTDVRAGFGYMVRTRWLLATLLFAAAMLLAFMGPFEVLVPFAIRAAGGGPSQHAYVLAAFGIGGAVGALVVASLRLPRRYQTVMNLLWGLGCLPLVVYAFTTELWVMLLAGAVMGATFQAGTVIWGTLLQRRVPSELLGRISSLDFFLSLSLMPLSMALAGPVSELIGLPATFVIGGVTPVVLAVVTIVAGRLPADELAHPLDVPAAAVDGPTADDRLDRV